MKALIMIMLLLLNSQINAKSLGVVGETFPVAEMSFLKFIEQQLASFMANGQWDTLQQHWLRDVARHANRPQQPLNLPRAAMRHTHYYIPEITLDRNIVDHQGHILYPAGTHINALVELPSYQPCWLLFNADDKAQVQWAIKTRQHCANPKLILTGGAIADTERLFNQTIYFDQAARITQKLAIHTVPSLVTREDNKLRIDEIAIKENGSV